MKEKESYSFVTLRHLNLMQITDLEAKMNQKIESLFKEWEQKKEKHYRESMNALLKQMKQDAETRNKTEKKQRESFEKHSNQVEKYLEGFNKLLERNVK